MHGAAYTAEDIKRYLGGQMSPAEMHALEKAALNDPFLADAIEGMEKNMHGFKEDAALLHKTIDQQAKKKSSVKIYWKAAAVLFVVTTAAAMVLLIDKKQPKTEEKVLAKVETRKDTPVILHRSDQPAVFKPEEKQEDKARAVTPPAPVLKDETEFTTIPGTEKFINIADSVQQHTPKNDTPVMRALQGNVAGIQVDKDAELDEVVVVGYSAKKQLSKKSSSSTVEARKMRSIAPEGGWEAFGQYLNENKIITGADSLKKGVQIISFTVGATGRPQDIKIRKSISPAHDMEAIRLLENGPDWKIIEGKKRKVRLQIIF